MSEEIKGLIEKIQQEGFRAAEDKAHKIEEEARGRAQEITVKAESEAEGIIARSKEDAARRQESTNALLQQAGRDLILNLKKEIDAMLQRVILSQVRGAMNTDELAKIITMLIKEYSAKDGADIVVALKKADLEKLKEGFFSRLKEDLKKGVTLKAAGEIDGGFVISFDAGKSHYDFTDKALAEYISLYLKPQLAEILEG